jgi:hypothetical protein
MDLHLPSLIITLLSPFSQMFSAPVWRKAQLLCIGAILCQGARRISSILYIMGLADGKRFEKYHRFLNRDEWSPLLGAKILFGLLMELIPPHVPILIVLDDTIERRKGKQIKAKGCYRDAVRSTEKLVVKCFGLKWLPLCLIIKMPWAKRPWALPFLTFLQYSKKYDESRNHRHRTTIDYAIIGVRFLSRRIKHNPWILLGDGGFACIELVKACRENGGSLISRLRIDARLYEEPPAPRPRKRGRKPLKGKRITPFKKMIDDKNLIWQEAEVNWYGGQRKKIQYLSGVDLMYKAGYKPERIRWVLVKDPEGKMLYVPLFSSNPNHKPEYIIETFVHRFSIEVLFEESRAHLGIETQRQWSDQAIIRTTPLLFGLFSIVCLIALKLIETIPLSVKSSAWYLKSPDEATFSDIIAHVRRHCWASRYLVNSTQKGDMNKLTPENIEFLIDRLAASP